jgi:hypothetical protein
MPDLRASRRKLKIVITAMAVVDAIAVAILFSPLAGSAASRREQINQLTMQLGVKTRSVLPLRGIDKKVDIAKQEINEFYKDRFASRDSDVAEELGKLAQENGVRILQARYKLEDPETTGIVPVEITANLSGDYLQLVRFINALERSQLFYTVDGVDLASESTGPIHLSVALHSYMRSGA